MLHMAIASLIMLIGAVLIVIYSKRAKSEQSELSEKEKTEANSKIVLRHLQYNTHPKSPKKELPSKVCLMEKYNIEVVQMKRVTAYLVSRKLVTVDDDDKLKITSFGRSVVKNFSFG